MKNIKDTYNEIESWLKGQNADKIKFLQANQIWDEKTELGMLQKTLHYWHVINEYSDKFEYVFGDKRVTLAEISKHMIDSMGNYGPKDGETEEEFEENCHHCGYADMRMFNDIKNFWKSLDENALISLACGSVTDDYEVDLDGYRCYFLSHADVYPLIFNYVFYTMGKSLESLEGDLYNSNETFDAIEHLYPPDELFLPDSSVIDRLYSKYSNEKTQKALNDFESDLTRMVKRFENEPGLKQKVEILKTIINQENHA